MDYSEELKEIFEASSSMDIIDITDIPDIDLYMDQVTTFMETKLSSFKRNKDDKILTKTMINNYAKAKIFPSPVKKKYNKNHMMMLILIYHLKYMLSINDIKKLLSPVTNELNENPDSKILENIYKTFVEIQKTSASLTIDDILNGDIFEKIESKMVKSKNAMYIKNILIVLILSMFSNKEKSIAEKIIDTKF